MKLSRRTAEDLRRSPGASNRFRAPFARPDADAIFEWQHEDLAVADLACRAAAPALDNGVDRRLDEMIVHRDLQLHFAKQIHSDFVTAIDFGLALLAAKTLHVHDREPHDFDL